MAYYVEEFLIMLGLGAVAAVVLKLILKKEWLWAVFLSFFIAYCCVAAIEIAGVFECYGAGYTCPLAYNLVPFGEGIGIDVLMNVVCTLPFGFLLPFVFPRFTIKKAFVAGLLFGLGMELTQLALYYINGRFSLRVIDITDVICNCLGTVIGWLFFAIVLILVQNIRCRGKDNALFRYIASRDGGFSTGR